MIVLILFILLVVCVLAAIEIRERKRFTCKTSSLNESLNTEASANSQSSRPEGCCGEHLVCERDTFLNSKTEIVYYDDEELDVLAGLAPETFTKPQHDMMMDVFATLQEKDVAGWCRSLQLRNIELPEDIREQALFIVREQRLNN